MKWVTLREQSCSGSCHKFALQPFFRAKCLLDFELHSQVLELQSVQSQPEWGERRCCRMSFLGVSQHRLSKQKAFWAWRATEMALTVSERLRVQSVASALQAGIGCVESAKKREKSLSKQQLQLPYFHSEALLGRKLPSVLCVYSAALLLLSFPILYMTWILSNFVKPYLNLHSTHSTGAPFSKPEISLCTYLQQEKLFQAVLSYYR